MVSYRAWRTGSLSSAATAPAPEISEGVRRVLEGTGVDFEWDWQDAGADVYEAEGTPLPDRVLDSIKERGLAIKGPITTPVGSGFRSINVALRKELDLYACLRPCKAYEGVRTRFPETDIVVVRENHEDLYAGVEYELGSESTAKLREFIRDTEGTALREDIGVSIKPISVWGTQRIVREAFDYAKAYDRRKVTAVHKANIMKYTDGLFLETARRVAEEEYPDIEFEDRIVDNLCNQLVSRPEEYDVVVLPNLYGDIVSDLGAGLIGGPRCGPRRQRGRRLRGLRGRARIGAQVQGTEQGQPDGADALRRDAPTPHRGGRRRGSHGDGDRGRDPGGRVGDLRHEALARRPRCGGHLGRGGRGDREAERRRLVPPRA